MALTLKWWTDLKNQADYKVDGKVAPETEFEKKLKAYDDLEVDSVPAHQRAVAALAAVESSRAASMNALQKTFPKLAAQVSPNAGRLLSTKITEEKTMLATQLKELKAKQVIGAPQMDNLGPGGATLRKKGFDLLQANIKKLNAEIRMVKTIDKGLLDNFAKFLGDQEKAVTLYCKDRGAAKPYHDDYVNSVAAFKNVTAYFEAKKMSKASEEWKKIGGWLQNMTAHQFVE